MDQHSLIIADDKITITVCKDENDCEAFIKLKMAEIVIHYDEHEKVYYCIVPVKIEELTKVSEFVNHKSEGLSKC